MTVVGLLVLLLVAGICGLIGQAIAGFSRGGFYRDWIYRSDDR